jgi:hypothetical protein
VPIEFGSIPLTPSDPLRQHPYGLLGALVVEPKGSSWRTDDNSRASAVVCANTATCTDRAISFREFVAVFQDDVAAIRETAPKYGAPNTITIQGTVLNGKVSWAMNGKPLPAAGVALTPGQVVNFEIGTGTHGLLFNDEASARAVFDIDGSPDKAKFHVFPTQCTIANAYGTTPQPSGHIATLTVKQAFTLDALPFICSQHCQNMPGSFTIALPPTTPAPFNYTRAINYKTEPLDYRYLALDFLSNLDSKVPLGISRALSNSLVQADPQTPIFAASNTTPVRMRLVHPAGTNEQVFTLHGHVWQEEPYVNGSKEIGNNPLSQSQGSRDGFGPNIAFDAVIDRAGGAAGTPGDYLYRTFIGQPFQYGMWGLLRVGEAGKDIVTITRFSYPSVTGGKVLITGTATVNPATGHMADQVTIFDTTGGAMKELGKADIDPLTGRWPRSGDPFVAAAAVKSILVRSAGNGEARAANYLKQANQSASGARRDMPDELALFNAMPRRMETILEASGAGPATAQWVLNERTPIAQNGTITIRPGDTITIAVRQGTHDLTFPDGALARSVFKFEMPGSPFAARPNVGQGAIGTRPLGSGTVLATLTVRSDIPAAVNRLTFRSVVDGQRMTATFVIQR